MRPRLAFALLLLLTAAATASAQRGPQLEVSVLGNGSTRGAMVRAARMLRDANTRELLSNGFPAALRFRLEIWRAEGFFDDLEDTRTWEALVRYDPYTQRYSVYRRGPGAYQDVSAPVATLAEAEAELEKGVHVTLPPRRAGARYYYNVLVDVETLSVSDLDELNRWLRGELQPAVRGKRAPLSALRRGFGTLISRVLGGDSRHYEARSGAFNG